jgi:hypothetical protein
VTPIVNWHLPIKTASEANSSEHWAVKAKRHKIQKKWIKAIFLKERPHISLPACIKLTRITPRSLDKDENLPMAFKYIKDYIADQIIPGLAPGRADDSKELTWEYDQEKGNQREYAVRIEIKHVDKSV